MVQLSFLGDTTERVYAAYLNNLAYANNNAVLSGCEVSESSPTAMTVDVTSGKIFFGIDEVDVSASSGISIDSNSSGFTRVDLVRVDSSGTIDILKGTAGELPASPNYDPDNYVVLGLLEVPNGISNITSTHIKDARVLNVGGSGSGGGAFARHVEPFTSQTSVTVTHNLADDEPNVFVYDDNNKIIIPQDITVTDVNELVVDFSISTTGKIIVYGGSGLNNAYYKEDFTSQTSLSISHNLNNQFVLVQVIDDSGNDIIPSTLTRTDENTVDITFGTSQSGTVIVAGGISTVDLISEEPDKNDSNIKSISVTDSSSNVTTDLSNVNSLLIVNEGVNTCYINFGSTATTNDFPIAPKGKVYLRDVNLLQIASICNSTETTTLKIQFFSGSKIGRRENVETIQISTTETSQTSALAGTPNFKYLLMINKGDNNIYYNFDTSVTTGTGVAVFPEDYIELNNINVSDIAVINDTGNTSDLRILNVY